MPDPRPAGSVAFSLPDVVQQRSISSSFSTADRTSPVDVLANTSNPGGHPGANNGHAQSIATNGGFVAAGHSTTFDFVDHLGAGSLAVANSDSPGSRGRSPQQHGGVTSDDATPTRTTPNAATVERRGTSPAGVGAALASDRGSTSSLSDGNGSTFGATDRTHFHLAGNHTVRMRQHRVHAAVAAVAAHAAQPADGTLPRTGEDDEDERVSHGAESPLQELHTLTMTDGNGGVCEDDIPASSPWADWADMDAAMMGTGGRVGGEDADDNGDDAPVPLRNSATGHPQPVVAPSNPVASLFASRTLNTSTIDALDATTGSLQALRGSVYGGTTLRRVMNQSLAAAMGVNGGDTSSTALDAHTRPESSLTQDPRAATTLLPQMSTSTAYQPTEGFDRTTSNLLRSSAERLLSQSQSRAPPMSGLLSTSDVAPAAAATSVLPTAGSSHRISSSSFGSPLLALKARRATSAGVTSPLAAGGAEGPLHGGVLMNRSSSSGSTILSSPPSGGITSHPATATAAAAAGAISSSTTLIPTLAPNPGAQSSLSSSLADPPMSPSGGMPGSRRAVPSTTSGAPAHWIPSACHPASMLEATVALAPTPAPGSGGGEDISSLAARGYTLHPGLVLIGDTGVDIVAVVPPTSSSPQPASPRETATAGGGSHALPPLYPTTSTHSSTVNAGPSSAAGPPVNTSSSPFTSFRRRALPPASNNASPKSNGTVRRVHCHIPYSRLRSAGMASGQPPAHSTASPTSPSKLHMSSSSSSSSPMHVGGRVPRGRSSLLLMPDEPKQIQPPSVGLDFSGHWLVIRATTAASASAAASACASAHSPSLQLPSSSATPADDTFYIRFRDFDRFSDACLAINTHAAASCSPGNFLYLAGGSRSTATALGEDRRQGRGRLASAATTLRTSIIA